MVERRRVIELSDHVHSFHDCHGILHSHQPWLLCWPERSKPSVVLQGWTNTLKALTEPAGCSTCCVPAPQALIDDRRWLEVGGGEGSGREGIRCSKLGVIQHISLMKSKS